MAIHCCPNAACMMSGHGTHLVPTTSQTFTYNGLCECLGPLNRHPFHSGPLPAEYVGKHRA